MTEKPNSVCKCGCPLASHCFSDGTFKSYCDDCPCKAFEPVAEPEEASSDRLPTFSFAIACNTENADFANSGCDCRPELAEPSEPVREGCLSDCYWNTLDSPNQWIEHAEGCPNKGAEPTAQRGLTDTYEEGDENPNNIRFTYPAPQPVAGEGPRDFHEACIGVVCAILADRDKTVREKSYYDGTDTARWVATVEKYLRPFITPACAPPEQPMTEEELADLQVIDERDHWEDVITDLAVLAGCKEEWSNLHEHGDCIAEEIHRLRAGSNYVADDEIYPTEVTFSNGRIVRIKQANGKAFLEIPALADIGCTQRATTQGTPEGL